jgi:hypothetical protein
LAGLQAQMLSSTISDTSSTAVSLTNAFWLAGIFLDVVGAVVATLTARWFELLDAEEIELLEKTWSAPPPTLPQRRQKPRPFLAWAIAQALFSAFGIVASGAGMFLLGLLIYVWHQQPRVVSIIFTIPFIILAPIVAAYFFPQTPRKVDIIPILAGKRGRW